MYYFHTELLPSEYRLGCFSQEEVVKNEVVVSAAQLVAAAAVVRGKRNQHGRNQRQERRRHQALAVLFKLPHQTDSRFSSRAKENVSICLNHFGC